MTLDVASLPVERRCSISRNDTLIPELLLLRFIGTECVEGKAGVLWQRLLSVDCDVALDWPSILPPEILAWIRDISQPMFAKELRFQQIYSGVGHDRRLLEAQMTTYPPDEFVVLLRDVTFATRARARFELSTSFVAMLSPREVEVLRLLVGGAPNKTVAARLQISVKTVEKHRASIMRKTGFRHTTELIRLTYPAFADQTGRDVTCPVVDQCDNSQS